MLKVIIKNKLGYNAEVWENSLGECREMKGYTTSSIDEAVDRLSGGDPDMKYYIEYGIDPVHIFDAGKTRRRVEDALRKTDRKTLIKVAKMLGIEHLENLSL